MRKMADFENALIELIDVHVRHGLTGEEARPVLRTRSEDSFEDCHQQVVGGPQTEAVKRFSKMGA